ncbi:MAG: hypothetical protein V4481_00005 [Patescibacteria group bacterium]
MINKELLDFVAAKQIEGLSVEQIRAQLMSGGWSDADINEAFSIKGTPPVAGSSAPKKHHYVWYILVIALILLAAYFFVMRTPSSQVQNTEGITTANSPIPPADSQILPVESVAPQPIEPPVATSSPTTKAKVTPTSTIKPASSTTATASAKNCGNLSPNVLSAKSLDAFTSTQIANFKCMDTAILACSPAYQTYKDENTTLKLEVKNKNSTGMCVLAETIKPVSTKYASRLVSCQFSPKIISDFKLHSQLSGQLSNGINTLIVFSMATIPNDVTGSVDLGNRDSKGALTDSIPCTVNLI